MPLELEEIGTSAGIGIVDNVLVELEERGMITGKLTYIKDGIRIGGAFGGLIVNYFIARPHTSLDTISGALTLSTLPLAFHSIRRLVKKGLKYGGSLWVLEEAARGTTVTTTPSAVPTIKSW
jgi:hypothetical protein